MRFEPREYGAAELLKAFGTGRLSPVRVAEVLLKEAERAGGLYRHIVRLEHDEALRRALESERRWASGSARALEGLPLALKGALLPGRWPNGGVPETLERLLSAGAYVQCVVVPGHGGSPLGLDAADRQRNPRDDTGVPGGSSTGSAIALAACHVPLALGSDAAGSIRIPSVFCGNAGLKPSRGTITRFGGPSLSPTLTEIGPMARSIEDIALLWCEMGPCSEPTSPNRMPETRVSPSLGLCLDDRLDPATEASFNQTIEAMRRGGAVVERVSLPLVDDARQAGWDILCFEVAISLAPQLDDLRRRPTSFLKYAERGATLSRRAYDEALDIGRAFERQVTQALTRVDALVTPGFCSPVPRHDDPNPDLKIANVGELYLPFNVSGHPALVVPEARSEDRQAAVQLVAAWNGESDLIRVGAWLEKLGRSSGVASVP